jgi:hypothetical protein
MELLLRAGADKHAKDKDGSTPLQSCEALRCTVAGMREWRFLLWPRLLT